MTNKIIKIIISTANTVVRWSLRGVSLLDVDESVPAIKGAAALLDFTVDDLAMDSDSGSMTEKQETLFQDAIKILEELKYSETRYERQKEMIETPMLRLKLMRNCMERVGLKVEDLDQLNIIHVTGTKGKGSTCAFTERILRGYGFRTGFYSSPHLVQQRERIRINGLPIEKKPFIKHFWNLYRKLEQTKDAYGGLMPGYFGLLAVLAFHVFLEEKVDVAIIEVGIGGTYDCTNILQNPWVCGVSTLDLDHIKVLGDTITKIAWRKGGIFKPGVPAFTVKQPEDALAVLIDRAKELKCPLQVCPELEDYPADYGPLRPALAGRHQRSNASLALQLSYTWLQRSWLQGKSLPSTSVENTGLLQMSPFKPSPIMVKALADTVWYGRTQIVKHGAVTYFLDGAHTMRSMQACADWFMETAAELEKNASGPVVRVLLFNTTGERDSAAMLKLLMPCHFDVAVFCTNIPEEINSDNAVQQNGRIPEENTIAHCQKIEKIWYLHNSQGNNSDVQLLIEDSLPQVSEKKAETHVFPCILSALQWIIQGRDSVVEDLAKRVLPVTSNNVAKAASLSNASEIHILITGSLYLVGGVLKHLDPVYSK